MVYKTITVIGVGSLGSFIINAISDIETVKKVICVDHDIVQTKNLKNTLYPSCDVGKLKVDSIYDMLSNKRKDLKIQRINQKFIEGQVKIPDSDLVIDCRDYTYNRSKIIDVRLYISSRYMIIDCRKNVNYEKQYKGKYTSELTKIDLRHAASIFSTLVGYEQIKSLIKTQSVQKVELDYLKGFIKQEQDIIYDSNFGQKRLVNLPDNVFPIMEANKKTPINLCLGTKDSPISENTIPIGMLTNGNDVVESLKAMLSVSDSFNNYVVCLSQNNNQFIVELVPETGAA